LSFFPLHNEIYAVALFLQTFLSIYFLFWSGLTSYSSKNEYTKIAVPSIPNDYTLKSSFPLWIFLCVDAWTSAGSNTILSRSSLGGFYTAEKKSHANPFMIMLFHPLDGLCAKLLGICIWCAFLVYLNAPPCFSSSNTIKAIQQYFDAFNNSVLQFQHTTILISLIFYLLVIPHIMLSVANHVFYIFKTLNKITENLLQKQSKKEQAYPMLANLNIYVIVFSFSVGVLAYVMPMIQQGLLFLLFLLNWTSHLSGFYYIVKVYMN